jgi:predicted ATP-grasp superfamily ATP-dependent carboligase
MDTPTERLPPALVVGLCAHGLTLVHSLAARGVEVHAAEANLALPGARTQLARIHRLADIRGPGLVESLNELASSRFAAVTPVLFLTNDDMVRTVAERWPEMHGRYRLSWSGCAEAIARLLPKAEHESRSAAVGCRYPSSVRIGHADEVRARADELRFPAIAKPSRPLSSFKVHLIDSMPELEQLVHRHPDSLPIMVQPFIPGGDDRIFFAALYLRDGEVIARFEGRKLRSRPMGHTTIAMAHSCDRVHAEATRFFDGLRLSGPVSLELKLDGQGTYWVIEPTVGRTDFWVGACIANGIDLPWIEYCDQAGIPAGHAEQRDRRIWFNPERDPAGPLWYAARVATGRAKPRLPTFTYAHRADRAPMWAAVSRKLKRQWRARTIEAF